MTDRYSSQVAEAKANIQKMKEAAPYIYPQYNTLLVARREYENAKKELDRAQKAWDNL